MVINDRAGGRGVRAKRAGWTRRTARAERRGGARRRGRPRLLGSPRRPPPRPAGPGHLRPAPAAAPEPGNRGGALRPGEGKVAVPTRGSSPAPRSRRSRHAATLRARPRIPGARRPLRIFAGCVRGWPLAGRMTNPAAAQNQEIDCLSPEAQRLVRGEHVFETFGSDCECLDLVDVLGPAEGGRHLPPQPSVPGEVWVGPAWPRTPLCESPSPREDVRRGGGGMCSVQFAVSFVLPALRPGKHVSSDGVPYQGEKELGLVRSGRTDGLGPVECFDRGSSRDLRPARGLEFHSELLVWCFTKHSTWALVARGGAFALRLAPPVAGWFGVLIFLWALEPSLAPQDSSSQILLGWSPGTSASGRDLPSVGFCSYPVQHPVLGPWM